MKPKSVLVCFMLIGQLAHAQRPDFLKKDSLFSSLDNHPEVFYYSKSTSATAQPLVVELHSWSNSSHSQLDMMAKQTHEKNWNFIFPNFRGVNNQPKTCCSDYVISDIDETIDWALKNMKVDATRIYIIGFSGGGYATFAIYMKSRHRIHSFSAWCGISDLNAWYHQSVERKNLYGPDIIKCSEAGENYNEQKAKDRSPLYWNTPVKKRKKAVMQIYAGIHDGYTGSVPVSHSIDFYNKLLSDTKEKDVSKYVSGADAAVMLKQQMLPGKETTLKIEDRKIHYRNSSKKISITLFEGGHEILRNAVLEKILNN